MGVAQDGGIINRLLVCCCVRIHLGHVWPPLRVVNQYSFSPHNCSYPNAVLAYRLVEQIIKTRTTKTVSHSRVYGSVCVVVVVVVFFWWRCNYDDDVMVVMIVIVV